MESTATSFRFGLDEAGYGPVLGPLVLGAVRTDGSGRGLRDVLRRRRSGLPRIADSKSLYRGGKGLEALELTALAARAVHLGRRPANLHEFLGEIPEGLSEHPWYADLDLPLPLAASPESIDAAATALEGALQSCACSFGVVRAVPLLEGSINRRMTGAGNKARLELEIISAILDADLPAEGHGAVLCDRLGGRRYYGEWLQVQFPFAPLDVIDESVKQSRYLVEAGTRRIEASWLVGGESREPEIALASCLAKYTREAMMHLFNRFWTARHPELAPTAGYPTDARRFLAALEGDPFFEAHRDTLIRCR